MKNNNCMSLHGIRLGHANNSSSTHSILFGQGLRDSDVTDFEYGWDDFTLASRASKTNYLISQVIQNMAVDIPLWMRIAIVKSIFGSEAIVPSDTNFIDHQSVWKLPSEYGTPHLSREFIDDLNSYILQNNLAIVGGNDNGGGTRGVELPIFTDYGGSSNVTCRKDPANGYWTLYNRESGDKVRIKFSEGIIPVCVRGGLIFSTPELVDLKITDMCLLNCPYCYQNSSQSGVHAKYSNIVNIINQIADMKVFEVAIGGGEPTLHPDFLSIIKYCNECGISPSFTTASLSWMDTRIADEIVNSVASFAFTPHDRYEIDTLAAYLRIMGIRDANDKIYINIPMGTMNRHMVVAYMKEAYKNGFRVTLLGYKRTGRGATATFTEYPWIISEIRKLHNESVYVGIGIDSVMLNEYGDSFRREFNVDPRVMTPEEGVLSMYVDAVRWKAGHNSYCDPDTMVPFGDRHFGRGGGVDYINGLRDAFMTTRRNAVAERNEGISGAEGSDAQTASD